MKKASLDIELLDEIDPSEASLYLTSKGWERTHQDEYSIAWQKIVSSARVARILLPLDKSLPDFCDRMYELVRAVASVESRPESDVFSSMRSSVAIAKADRQQIIRFRLSSNHRPGNSIPAKKLGSLLVNFQSLINAIAQYEEGKATENGSIPQYITERTQFLVTSTFEGSFGITLINQPLEIEQTELFEEKLVQRSLRNFMELLRASKRESELRDHLIRIKKRAISNYRAFLGTLSNAGTDTTFEWGSPENENSERVELSLSDVVNAFDVVSRTMAEEPIEIEIPKAEWVGGTYTKPDFEIRDMDTDISYKGLVSDKAVPAAEKANWRNIYRAVILEDIEIIQSTQERRSRYTLLSLENYEEAEETVDENTVSNSRPDNGTHEGR